MNCLEEKWEPVISQKQKHRGCIFIRVKNKYNCFVMKIYGHNQAQEVADTIITEHNAKIDAEEK